MAVSLVSEPSTSGVNYVNCAFSFEFVMTGVLSATECRRFGYQLICEDGTPVTALEQLEPKDGVPFCLDFQLDISKFVYTPAPPTCNGRGSGTRLETVEGLEKKFYLEYWEVVFNKEDCISTIEGKTSTARYCLLNSAPPYWGLINTSTTKDLQILTYMPEYKELCRDSCDFIYIYGGGTVLLVGWLANGKLGPILGKFSGGADTSVVVIDGSTIPENVTKVEVKINGVTIGNYVMKKCCCENGAEIAFQSSLGGYSILNFCKAKKGVKNTSREVCRWVDKNAKPNSREYKTQGGISVVDKKSYRTYSLTTDIPYPSKSTEFYLESFLSSGSHFVNIPIAIPSVPEFDCAFDSWVKFKVTSGAVFADEDKCTLTVSGQVLIPHTQPNYR